RWPADLRPLRLLRGHPGDFPLRAGLLCRRGTNLGGELGLHVHPRRLSRPLTACHGSRHTGTPQACVPTHHLAPTRPPNRAQVLRDDRSSGDVDRRASGSGAHVLRVSNDSLVLIGVCSTSPSAAGTTTAHARRGTSRPTEEQENESDGGGAVRERRKGLSG